MPRTPTTRGALALSVATASLAACSASAKAPVPAGTPSAGGPSATSTAGPSAAKSAAVNPTSGTAATSRVATSVAAFQLPATLSRAQAFLSSQGQLLVISGLHDGDTSTNAVVEIAPSTGQVTVPLRLPMAVHDAAGAMLGGKPTIFGGGAAQEVAAVQQYDPATHQVRELAALPSPSSDCVAAAVAQGVVIAGGYDGTTTLNSVLLLTGTTGVAKRIATLPVAVRYPAVAVIGSGSGQRVLLFGGESGGVATDVIQEIDVQSGQARVVGHLPAPRTQASALVLGGTVFLAGGSTSGTSAARQFADVLRYNPANHTVTNAGTLPYAVADAAAVAVNATTGYLIGGETPSRTSRSIIVRLAS